MLDLRRSVGRLIVLISLAFALVLSTLSPGAAAVGSPRALAPETAAPSLADPPAPTATLSGQVLGPDGQGLDGIVVEAVPAASTDADPLATDITYQTADFEHGGYVLHVPAGSYKVRFSSDVFADSVYETRYYGGAGGTTLTVVDGDATALDAVTMVLDTGAPVTGRVDDTAGHGIVGLQVRLYNWSTHDRQWYSVDSTYTGTDGGYRFRGVNRTIKHTLRFIGDEDFDAEPLGLSSIWLGGTALGSTAQPFTLPAGSTGQALGTTVMHPGIRLKGTILEGGSPWSYESVTLLGKNTAANTFEEVDARGTDERGRYQFTGLVPGATYTVLAQAGGRGSGLADTYLGDVTVPGSAHLVVPSAATNPQTLADIHVVKLPVKASGLVTDTAAHPLERVQVDLYEIINTDGFPELDYVEEAETDDTGRYTFHQVAPGRTYTVFADGFSAGFGTHYLGNTDDESAVTTFVPPATGNPTLPAIALSRARSTVSAHVALEGGAPINGEVDAQLYRWVADDSCESGWCPEYVKGDYTIGSRIVFRDVPAGDNYTVNVDYQTTDGSPRLYGNGWYGNGGYPTSPEAMPGSFFSVEAGAPGTFTDKALGTITLPRGRVLHGQVTTEGGQPAYGETSVDVARWIEDDTVPNGGYFDFDTQSANLHNGTYTFVDLEPGTYFARLSYYPEDAQDDFMGDDYSWPTSPDGPGTFTVGTAPDQTGPGLQLVHGTKVSGRTVTGAGAMPLPGSNIYLYKWVTDDSGTHPEYLNNLNSDRLGRFSTFVRPGTVVTVQAEHARFDTTYLGGGTELPTSPVTSGTGRNSVAVGAADIDLGDLAMTPQWGTVGSTTEGSGAGQQLSYCLQQPMYDSAHVYFGPREGLYLSGTGVISDQSLDGGYRPELLRDDGRVALLALFMDRPEVTSYTIASYGVSPDGQTLCALWQEVGDDSSDLTNTYQALVTKAPAGGYDVTYNYDHIGWASDARAGYTAGTGSPQVFPGAATALVSHQDTPSSQAGRYKFHFTGFSSSADDAPYNDLPPKIDGTIAVGQTVVATPGTWYVDRTPRDDLHFVYTWMSNVSGGPLPVGYGPTHVIADAEKGGKLWVSVQAVQGSGPQAGFGSSARVTVPVGPPVAHNASPPTLSTIPAYVGNTLSASTGTWDQFAGGGSLADVTFRYRWFRNGLAISGATNPTYLVRDADENKAIKVRVTAVRTGYASVPVYSAPTTILPSPALTNLTAPTLSGDPAVGKALTVTPGTWQTNNTGTPEFTYKWVVDQQTVDADPGDGTKYTVKSGDVGKYVTVYVTARHPGFTSGLAHVSSPAIVGSSVSFGTISGTVTRATGGAAVSGATWQACEESTYNCVSGYTDATGKYVTHQAIATTAPGVGYTLTIYAPSNTNLKDAVRSTSLVTGVPNTVDVSMDEWAPAPPNVTVPTAHGSYEGAPTVFWGEPQNITVVGCIATPSPQYTVTFSDGSAPVSGSMVESPLGTYKATLAPFYPAHGAATITTNIKAQCSDATPTKFDVYIDPSGVVTDQYGRPINGATVTLLRSDTPGGAFTQVPDGSTVMSSDNRKNPDTTGPDALRPDRPAGFFRWDVTPGYYKVRVEKTGCTPYTTSTMPVPPPAIDLMLKMSCTGAAPPPTAPTIAGSAALGKTLTTPVGLWGAPYVETVQWLRDGVAIAGATQPTYVVTAADIAHKITARHVAQRPAYQPGVGNGPPVTFATTPAADSAAVTIAKLRSTTTGTMVKKTVTRRTVVKMTVKVSSGLTPTGRVTVYRGSRAIKAATMSAASRGRLVISLGKFKKGKYSMSARYGGSGQISASKSRAVTLIVK